MNINPSIFKSYDIRAIYPDQINEKNISEIIKAIYKFFTTKIDKENFTVALARDMRISSPAFYKIAIETLVSLGANVIDMGLMSTPTFYFAVFNYKYDCGIQITASHNPKEYNGAKFVMYSPNGLIKIGKETGMENIKNYAISGVDLPTDKKGAIAVKTHVLEDEVENAAKILGNPRIKKFKIVADPANAMGGTYIDAFVEKYPTDLVRMNFELDGTFPVHQPDPFQPKNLVDLQKRVLEEKADLGLAPDGDGDRLFFIDEKGQAVPPTVITALVARELLKEYPGSTVLFDIRYILTPKKVIEENGGKYGITKVGHAFITEQMEKTGAIFAGESSAHYYFKATGNAESQVTIMLVVLKVLGELGKPFSEVVKDLQKSFESGEINFKVSNATSIIEAAKKKYGDGKLDLLDGVAINYPNWRFSLRTSNTEPLLRLNVESYDKKTMEEKKNELVNYIESFS
ncbi:MAG: phosphomannomutase/phosphoglucomutase [Candidatus Levybacteria bacterium]|nr:phosphomannomutase/phosphoglucomutase [Candidatus Levybacteria bacterium]